MSTTKVYTGLIQTGPHGENDDALFVGDDRRADPFAEQLADDIAEHGAFLTVRYFISDEPKTEDELIAGLIARLAGAGDALYQDRYSEITGYLWTDEELNVGGHDLMEELRSHAGRYLWMEVAFLHAAVRTGGGTGREGE